jgi:NAD(P)-dependent dehydrogenase (short-subunit alcohol dehydrogenase family)
MAGVGQDATHGVGPVALVTGGGRGIGRATALTLARAGFVVAAAARSSDQLAETQALAQRAGGHLLPLALDVTDQPAVEAAVDRVEGELGPVELLVNGAGIAGPVGPLWDVDPGAWWRAFEVNLRGTMLCTWALLRRMIPRRRGRVVNLASGAGTRPGPYTSDYACAKAAVIRLTDSVAQAAAEFGIAIFAISPGVVRTALTEAFMQPPAGPRWLSLHTLSPDDWTPAERAAELILLLASGRADALSGRFFHVTDDVAALVAHSDDIRQRDLYTLRLQK